MSVPTASLPEVRRLCATLAAGRRAAERLGDGLVAVEILTTPATVAIVAVRR